MKFDRIRGHCLDIREHTFFLVGSFLSVLVMLVLALRLFTFPKERGAHTFGWLLLLVALWSFAVGGGMLTTTQQDAFLWILIRMAAVFAVPVVWLIFTLRFSGIVDRLRPVWIGLLSVIPMISFILLSTASHQNWFIVEIEYQQVGPYFVDVDWQISTLFWLHLVYSFGLILIGDFFLLRQAFRWSSFFQRRMIIIIIATLFPLFTNLALTFNLFPEIHGNYDVIGFVVAGVFLWWGLFSQEVFDLRPIAHKMVIQNLPEAVFLFDESGRLLEMNAAADEVICGKSVAPGDRVETVFDLQISFGQSLEKFEYQLVGSEHRYEVRCQPVLDGKRYQGQVVMFRNITEERALHDQLEKLSRTDMLTGIANRRYFFEQGQQLLQLSQRYSTELSLIMLDIDHFKAVNDQYGHQTGDVILKEIADILKQNCRTVDIVGRMGGEEFTIVLPETDLEAAAQLAERLRRLIRGSVFQSNGRPVQITASMGVSSVDHQHQISLEQLIDQADQALYQSKMQGRDCTTCWQQST